MTRMIPPTIGPSVRSSGERRIFSILKDAPGTEGWTCLHSLGLARHERKRRAEIDFLLLTEKAVLTLEVKAGRVRRQDGFWIFTDRSGHSSSKQEGPYEQASSAMFALEEDLRVKFGRDKSRLANLLLGYGVLFPDIEFDATGTEGAPEVTYDLRDRSRPITDYVERLIAFTRGRQSKPRYSPRREDITELVDFLRGDFDLVPSMHVYAEDVVQQMTALTHEQYAVLDAIDAFPRVLVQGAAGTGKSLLAAEAARRESNDARRVGVICFNRFLAKHLSSALKEHSGCTVLTVYQLMDRLIRESSLADEFRVARQSWSREELFEQKYPDYAQLALLERDDPVFDTLIVDEAQDVLNNSTLDVLDSCIPAGLEAGRWRIFLDANNQAGVYGTFEQSALDRLARFGHSCVLSVNCRNTTQISAETNMIAAPRLRSLARISGVPVEYSWFDNAVGQLAALRGAISSLVREGVQRGRITILSPLEDGCAKAANLEHVTPLTEDNVSAVVSGQFLETTCSTVSSFKGLENDFIILTDVEHLDTTWWQSVIYVGMSRARVGLHVLLPKALKPMYDARVRALAQTLIREDGRSE